MSNLRHLRRHLQPKRLRIALVLERMQRVEPNPHKLRENFPQIFNQVFGAAAGEAGREVFEPLQGPPAPEKVADAPTTQ